MSSHQFQFDETLLLSACRERLTGPLAVLFGGWSSERAVSLDSGHAVANALKNAGLDVLEIDVDRNVTQQLHSAGVRHVFNALHGPGGEDGVIGGLLEFLNITCTGSGVLGSALAMDKLRSKQLWNGIGLSTPEFELLSAGQDFAAVLDNLGGKVMVKPCREGSSIGMAIATDAEELAAAYAKAAEYDSVVIAERYIEGNEYSISFVADKIFPAVQLETNNSFYDYDAKYVSDETKYTCPVGLPAEQMKEADALALQAYQSLACEGWGRVDLLQDADDRFYVLEVNTVPGMTSHSIVPMAGVAAGASFTVVVLNILLASLVDAEVGAKHVS